MTDRQYADLKTLIAVKIYDDMIDLIDAARHSLSDDVVADRALSAVRAIIAERKAALKASLDKLMP